MALAASIIGWKVIDYAFNAVLSNTVSRTGF